ncbi:MAG: DUF2075 domain-containing protein [Acidobacteria bacterium]|nr:MAG: DUF2075 domain-containing protein [Acidobacteriota bacterium]
MQLYCGTTTQFVDDTLQNRITGRLEEAFFTHFRYRPSHSEVNSWRNSLRAMCNVVQYARLDDNGLVLEYQLPLTSKRLDFMITGRDARGAANAVIVELKQWSEAQASNVDGCVATFVAGAVRDELHPSVQVGQYHQYLEDFNPVFSSGDVTLSACSYLHNWSFDARSEFFSSRHSSAIARYPLFAGDQTTGLATFMTSRVDRGGGSEVLQTVLQSKYKASKKLMEHVAGVIAGRPEYVLLDEQLVVFETVLGLARSELDGPRRTALIVKGGPGTGKSVIALNLMSRLLRDGFNAHYATGSRAFTETLRAIIGRRGAPQFMYFNSYGEAEPDAIDVLICDEAHRLRKLSGDRFRPSRTGKPQVEEILNAAKLAVFLIDDRQVVRPNEVGSSAYIREHAERLGCEVREHTLEAQFRCAGSDGFVNWIANTLAVERTANAIWEGDERFDFRIFPSPESLEQAIRARAAQGHSARLAAGFCWPWSKPNPDGTLLDDVVLGDWRRPWNARPEAKRLAAGIPKAQLWAHEPGGLDQVGCVYTAQGFEFDYIGVVFGRDLRYDMDAQAWIGDRKASFDRPVKQGGEAFIDLVKNTYRVLLSRGLRGCYVHFVDRDTERFFRTRIDGRVAEPRLDELLAAPTAVEPEHVEPFRRVPPGDVRPFETCVPLYDLAVAAGRFSDAQAIDEVGLGDEDRRAGDFTWVELPEAFRPQRGLFVARVVGDSMNRRIPNGAWCLFRRASAGSRNDRVVVAQHRDIADPETGGRFTVKVYESKKERLPDGSWRHTSIVLRPDTTAAGYEPIVLAPEAAADLRIVAELVAVLG